MGTMLATISDAASQQQHPSNGSEPVVSGLGIMLANISVAASQQQYPINGGEPIVSGLRTMFANISVADSQQQHPINGGEPVVSGSRTMLANISVVASQQQHPILLSSFPDDQRSKTVRAWISFWTIPFVRPALPPRKSSRWETWNKISTSPTHLYTRGIHPARNYLG
jgi:hypothetical protein